MIDLMLHFLAGIVVGGLGAMSPGPDTLLVLRSVAAGGRRAGTRAALGIGLGLAVHAVLTAVLVLCLRESGGNGVLRVLQLAGAAFLAYLGVSLLRACWGAAGGDTDPGAPAPGQRRYFWQGFLTNVTNPKVVVFFISIVSPFLVASDVASALAVLAGILVAIPAWFVLLSLLATRVLGNLAPGRRRVLDLVAGLMFLALAVYGAIPALT
jgi:threonine/homoserine/homoserine lactone efflux protein